MNFDTLPPQDPPPEDLHPTIHRAITDPANVKVLPVVSSDDHYTYPVTLMRAKNAERAYARIEDLPGHRTRHIRHQLGQHQGIFFTGVIFFAICYPRVTSTAFDVFQEPSSDNAQHVAIKKIHKKPLRQYLRLGGRENPYMEIARMQELGDNTHVLSCVEALEDDDFLYIITPMGVITLAEHVQSMAPQTMSVNRARQLFQQILKILLYLEAHGISHRDLSPDNLLFLTPDNLVAFDLAMSVRNPVDASGRRLPTRPQGTFGTPPFMPPEIWTNRIHDGLAVDLWAAACNLYFMLTGRRLYSFPHPRDLEFCFFVLARGLSDAPLNDLSIQAIMDAPGRVVRPLLTRVEEHRRLIDPSAMEVLQNVLVTAPWERWTLAQVIESDFVQGQTD